MHASRLYDPNSEKENAEQVAAGHWELLRRNPKFREVSQRWIEDRSFREALASSGAYHHMEVHTPRCAWDWMLDQRERLRLAELQIHNGKWFINREYNFGPIVPCHEKHPSKLNRQNAAGHFKVLPLKNPPAPLSVNDAWDVTPAPFKAQFRLARRCPYEFEQLNEELHDSAHDLRAIAMKFGGGDPLNEKEMMADHLWDIGTLIRNRSEFWKVFAFPRARFSKAQLHKLFSQIEDSYRGAGLLVDARKYDLHRSFQGTSQDWYWFLIAEEMGLDIRKAEGLRQLAILYVEDLRERRKTGRASATVKAHGFRGQKVSAREWKNRRKTVKARIVSIRRWIDSAFPKALADLVPQL